MQALPDDWKADSVSRFISSIHSNHFASFANNKAAWKSLAQVNDCFENIKPKLETLDAALVVPALFFIRSHSTYLGALNVALAMQVQEIFPMARSILESASYATFLNNNKNLVPIWLDQSEDERSRKIARRTFSGLALEQHLTQTDSQLASWYTELYRRCIEFGAHPTSGAVVSNLGIERNDKKVRIVSSYLSAPGPAHHHALSTLRSSALCALNWFQKVFPNEFVASGTTAFLEQVGKPTEPSAPPPILRSNL